VLTSGRRFGSGDSALGVMVLVAQRGSGHTAEASTVASYTGDDSRAWRVCSVWPGGGGNGTAAHASKPAELEARRGAAFRKAWSKRRLGTGRGDQSAWWWLRAVASDGARVTVSEREVLADQEHSTQEM
jgi:hypothetical protein